MGALGCRMTQIHLGEVHRVPFLTLLPPPLFNTPILPTILPSYNIYPFLTFEQKVLLGFHHPLQGLNISISLPAGLSSTEHTQHHQAQ